MPVPSFKVMQFLPEGMGVPVSPEAGMVSAKGASVEIMLEGNGFGKDV